VKTLAGIQDFLLAMKPSSPITLIGGDIDEPPLYAEPIIRAIGIGALHWGRLEQHLSALILSINKEEWDTSGAFRDMPNTSFEAKIQLFKKWFAKDPRLAPFHSRAIRLVPSLKALNSDRKILFHSNLQGFSEGPPAKAHFMNVRVKGDSVIQSEAAWTADEIRRFADGAQRLNRGLHTITLTTP
jgi:hypothetical protein